MPVDKGAYNVEAIYMKLDMVHTSDSTYVSKVDDNVGHAVTDTTYWQCYADGKPATEAAGVATAAANAATTAAAAANAAAARAPYIGENGDWYIWSVQQQEFVDSGIDATAPELTIGDDYTIYKDGQVFTTAIKDAHVVALADHEQYLQDHASIASKANVAANAVAGHMATLDANGNPTESGISPEELARIDGYYETMGVGIAKNLEGRNDVVDSFVERTTGGDAEVSNGVAQLNEVAGRSQVWNQLVQNGNFADGFSGFRVATSHGTATAIDGVCHVTAIDADKSPYIYPVNNPLYILGHKYLFSAFIKGAVGNVNIIPTGSPSQGQLGYRSFPTSGFTKAAFIWESPVTLQPSTSTKFQIRGNASIQGEIPEFYVTNINVIDLTLLGIDNLTTVEEVEAWLAKNIGLKPYYPYNAGTVLNAKMKGIESLGFNLLDPTTGKARIVGAYSDVYGNYYGITGTRGTLTFTSDLGEVSEITPDSDGKFLISTPGWLNVASAGADCAVFLWWDGTKTEYEEYDRNVANFDATHIYGRLNGTGERVQVFPDGMGGISAKDVVRVEDGVTVARKRMGKVADMGTLNWRYNDSVFRAELADLKVGGNCISSLYRTTRPANIVDGLVDKAIAVSGTNKNVLLADSAYTSAADFKAAMSGVPLYYELATEQLYTDLVYIGSDIFPDGTPVTLPVNYIVNNWGIERQLPIPSDGDPTSIPAEVSIRYTIDAAEQLDTIEKAGIFTEDLKANIQALLAVVNAKLETAMGGTIAIGSTPVDKVYPFTFVPSSEPEPESEGE